MNESADDGNHRCAVCGRRFDSEDELRDHLFSVGLVY